MLEKEIGRGRGRGRERGRRRGRDGGMQRQLLLDFWPGELLLHCHEDMEVMCTATYIVYPGMATRAWPSQAFQA